MPSREELREIRQKRRLNAIEKLAYIENWQRSGESQRTFCEQEQLSLSTFSGWLKSSCKKPVDNPGLSFIPVEISPKVGKAFAMPLQFKFPNGLVSEGEFLLEDVSLWLKELSHAITALC